MDNRVKQKRIAYWLLLGVVMLMVQVLLGGITRLTGSGLSMTEWNPIMGFIPPLNESQWLQAFEQYKQIGQFKYLNQDFTLGDFKFIFFWEWFHRFWARFIAIAFVIPFIYFLIKKYFTAETVRILVLLFLMGAAQGAIGWIMVASGLNDEALYVSHIKLAMHFVSAMILIAVTFWFSLRLLISDEQRIVNSKFKNFTWIIFLLLIIQLVYGAYMAGLKAGSVAATWPSINGDMVPSGMLNRSWHGDGIAVHFIHRGIAYLLFLLILLWTLNSSKIRHSVMWNRWKWLPLGFTTLQVLLGIFTVLKADKITRNGFGSFEYLAQAHQLVAMLLAMSLVWALFMLRSNSKPLRN